MEAAAWTGWSRRCCRTRRTCPLRAVPHGPRQHATRSKAADGIVTLACIFANHGVQSGAGSPGHLQALEDTGDSMSDGRGGANGPMRGSGFMRSPNSNFPAPSSKGFVTASPTRISAAVTAGERQSNPSASRLAAPRGSGDMPTRGCFGGDRYRDASRTCKFGGPEMAEVAVISGAEPSSRVPSTILFGRPSTRPNVEKFKRLLRTNHPGFCRRKRIFWAKVGGEEPPSYFRGAPARRCGKPKEATTRKFASSAMHRGPQMELG